MTQSKCDKISILIKCLFTMDEYADLKKSSLKFKGEKRKKKQKSKANEETGTDHVSGDHDEKFEDAADHGGWWKVEKYEQLRGEVAIEFLPGCYAKAVSNGSIVLGNPHPPGEAPDEEEIFTAICAATNQVAFKSGFGRYLSIDSRKHLVGLSEAIGIQESFLPVFEDRKSALSAYNDCFLAPDEESEVQPIIARATKVGAYEMLTLRTNTPTTRRNDSMRVV